MPSPRSGDDQQNITGSVDCSQMSAAMAAFLDDNSGGNTDEHSALRELQEFKTIRVEGYETCLKWWQRNKNRFPRLYSVARLVFAIPASSAAPERMFSMAGRLVNYRPNIRSELVDEILFLKSNFDLFSSDKIPLETQGAENVDEENLIHISDDESDVVSDEVTILEIVVGSNI